ncbi:MAG TPA: nitroreductase family protein [Acidimicrobiales bacterium]|nr:nitroreductase family protein [Acidimicrobiales bacterium]
MASVVDAIYGRRAVRAYRDEAVSRGDIAALIEAAVQAPSAGNVQPWRFVVVQDPTLLDRFAREAKDLLLAEPPPPEVATSGLPDLDRLRRMVADPGYVLFHGAPALVVIYATSADGVPDCFLAAQNLMLAAWERGLGTCPIGLATPLLNRAEVKRELGTPSAWVAALPVVVGHPAGPAAAVPRNLPVVTWR